MKNNKKTIIIISIILGVLVLTIGLTYSIFTISKTGKNSNLVVGDVYMHYANGSNAINLTNVLPTETYDATSFFEFTIDGKNTTTNKDIWYEIILKHGDEVSGKTRIKDNLLKFTLTETKNGTTTTVFDGRSYNDLTSKRIWVNTINRNTTSEVSITYRLYMWISNDTVIGNTNDVDYTMEEWENIFASIKVDVAGDFDEKNIATDEACFTTGITKTYQVNNNMTTDELNKCTTYVTSLKWDWYTGETPEAFCKGTGTNQGGVFQTLLNYNVFSTDDLDYFETNNIITSVTGVAILDYDATCGSDVIIPSTIKGYPVTVIGNTKTNIIEQLSNKINNYKFNDLNNYNKKYYVNPTTGSRPTGSFERKNLIRATIPDTVMLIQGGAFANNNLTTIKIPDNAIEIGDSAFVNNQLANITIPNSVTTIGGSAFYGNQLASIIIPDSVTTIGDDVFRNNQLADVSIGDNVIKIGDSAFSDNQLTSITIPNSVTAIGDYAFNNNQLVDVSIGDNVSIIGYYAFADNKLSNIILPNSILRIESDAFAKNQLTNVTFGNKISEIGTYAFRDNQLTSVTIPDSVTTIGYSAFWNNQLTDITIGNGIQYIGSNLFNKYTSSNPNLSRITINKSCADIKNIPSSSTDTTKYYPWLDGSSPYTATGVTIYGSNNEVCDSY